MRDLHLPGRSPAMALNAMAATSMPVATLAALDIMRAGGNALDGAIAAAAVLAVVEPQSTGIGGDCWCLYAPASGGVVAINGSGRAPAAATPEALRAAGLTEMVNTSVHSVTVPGAISAWELLNKTHGKVGLDQILQPAIRYAEEGFAVSSRVSADWEDSVGKLSLQPQTARRFLKDGKPYAFGDRFTQPELGKTLRAIAKDGARAFYTGAIAADMVAALRAAGGLHTEEDFAEGQNVANFVDPISRKWRDMEVFQCPPNGSGLLVLMLLGILEGFPDPAGPLDATRVHRHMEAARLVYRDRDAFLADPSQVEVPVEKLLSDGYLDKLRGMIRDDKAMEQLPPAGDVDWQKHKDTVYLTVVDKDGNACSFINSLFEGFGSGILAEGSGVMLQNRGFGFRLQEGHPNCIAPRKRPMHTIIPGMVMKDGKAIMPYGVMGGHYQPMGQTWFLTNHFQFGLDVQEALDLTRVFPSVGANHRDVEIETGLPPELKAQLAALGHQPKLIKKPHGGGQAILIDRERGILVGGSDPRKDGCAMGY
ncbi:gamma-glutamyltransferase family protein [Roseomonas sp. SSH11]|uniref:Gamma-glutamyltransferase family protein n=1 Tax=Pararoseomonas baculiformis TaxID=2820812 RepID=A0ABS4AAJ1_9PROT|nr:gamma-glutamyltransferase family protein [Pararoseomonas baculiformis]MBP0444003.1 gamma-glutamyltransferase family protein [Pararoseomonas baculiformis]